MTDKKDNFPSLFLPNSDLDSDLCFYTTSTPSKNNKIIFKQNLICFVLQGQKEIYSNENRIFIDKNKFFFLKAGNSLMSEKITNEGAFKSVLLFFSDNFITNFVSKQQVDLSFYESETKSIIDFEKDNFIANFEQSLQLLYHTLKSNPNIIETKINELLLYLLATNSKKSSAFFHHLLQSPKTISIRKIVEKHQNQNLTISEIAFLCNMSVSTFKRRFSEIYNSTPKQFLIKSKMENAVMMLKQKKKPSEIYSDLGYENLSSFSYEFKKYFGVTPSHFIL